MIADDLYSVRGKMKARSGSLVHTSDTIREHAQICLYQASAIGGVHSTGNLALQDKTSPLAGSTVLAYCGTGIDVQFERADLSSAAGNRAAPRTTYQAMSRNANRACGIDIHFSAGLVTKPQKVQGAAESQ